MNRRTYWLLVGTLILGALVRERGAYAGEPLPTARSARPAAAKLPVAVVTTPPSLSAPPPPPRGPKVKIMNSINNHDGTVTLELEATTEDGSIPTAELRIDQQLVPDAHLEQTRDMVRRSNQFQLTVTLPPRDCVVSVVARSRTAKSPPVIVRLLRSDHGLTLESRPAMYVLAAGIDKYRHSAIGSLEYSSKDASALATALTRQSSSVYFKIEPPRVLLDQDATRPKILEGLDWLQQNVLQGDTAVIFLAGHGWNENKTYYYLTYESGTEVSTMLSGPELQGKLRKIKGRVLLILDTCHSGGVIDDSSLKSLFSDITNENQIAVFSASTRDQKSKERGDWGHGAFTKALLEGLAGRADISEDRQLSLGELALWVETRVKELTAGHQTPNLANPNAQVYTFAALPTEHVLLTREQLKRRKILAGLLGGGAGVAVLIGILAARPWEFTGRSGTDLVFH